jgi:pimeloyl-ACP methyl ester carboxylesterase
MARSITFTAADGRWLAGERLAGPGPTIVLLHAGVADRRAWSDVAAELNAAGADVISYDRRGFGETPAAGTPDHRADLGAVLSTEAEGPAWLVGNSQGGRIALDLALVDPDRVAGLVLIAPAVSGAPDPAPDELDAATRRLDVAIEAAEAAGDLGAVNRLEAHLWLDGPAGPEGRVGGRARELVLSMNAIALATEWPAEAGIGIEEPATWERLGEIEAPATVACGELDLPFFIDQCRTLAARLPNAGPMVELAGVAHLPGLEAPVATAALIRAAVGLQ